MEVNGIGSFDVHAMGRLAVIWTYQENEVSPGFVQKIPLGYEIPDLVLEDIAGTDLEAISKPPQRDEGAGELDKGAKEPDLAFVADEESTEVE